MSTTTPEHGSDTSDTFFPPDDAGAVKALGEFLRSHHGTAYLARPDGANVDVPDEVLKVLTRIVAAMRNGKAIEMKEGEAITLEPVPARLTTEQAAEMLGVSRPTLVRLLNRGEIPYEQPGKHRRVRLDDMLAFRDRRRQELDERARQAVLDRLPDAASAKD